jgi:hypothetical protein
LKFGLYSGKICSTILGGSFPGGATKEFKNDTAVIADFESFKISVLLNKAVSLAIIVFNCFF